MRVYLLADLQSFREALAILQQQVDDLDELKVNHYQEIVEHEEQVWDTVQSKVRRTTFLQRYFCFLTIYQGMRSCEVNDGRLRQGDGESVRLGMHLIVNQLNGPFFVQLCSSDPIVEPMLQSVPDPFDSYGPPQSEDQIFSILAPLSIMTAPSPSPSPVAGTPETEATSTLSSSHHKITSWLPGTSNGLYPVETSEWATASPPSSPPLSASTSPSSSSTTTSRRHSVPQRKAESKLRSVLPSIDESRTPHRSSLLSSSTVTTPRPQPPNTSEILKAPVARPPMTSSTMSNPSSTFTTINTTMPSQNSVPTAANGTGASSGVGGGGFGSTFGFGLGSWNFGYGHQPPEDDESQSASTTTSTPRMSALFTPPVSQSPPPPPGSAPSVDQSHSNTTNRDKREGVDQEPVYDPVPS